MTYAELAHDEPSKIALTIGAHEGDLAKRVPGAKWHDGSRTWRLPLSWPGVQALSGVFGPGLEAGPMLKEWAGRHWQEKAGPLTTLRSMDDLALSGPTAERLWPLQRVAVYAMVLAERYLVLDEMGGGKTRSTLAALKMAAAMHGEDQVFPALVVCPNKVRRTWRKQALEGENGEEAFWPELRMEVLPKGKPAQRKVLERFAPREHARDGSECAEAACGGSEGSPCPEGMLHPAPDAPQVLVANWEALVSLSRLEPFGNIELTDKEREPGMLNRIQWRTVVADEVHRAKDRKAKQTRALKAITLGTKAVGTGPARFRWGLTGTLVGSNSAEAWSILNWADEVAWPAYSRFVDRYATTTWNMFGGLEIGGVNPETREEFYRCMDPMSIRRLRQQFDPFKPKRMYQTLTVPMETRQAKAYNDLAKHMVTELDEGVLTADSAMIMSGRLHQLAQAYGEMVDRGRRSDDGELLLDLQLKEPSNKVKAMLEIVEERGIEPGGGANGLPVVFGAPSRQLIGLCEAALQKRKVPYALIAGGMTDAEQERNERLFESGQAKVALCVISAAKEGLNSLVAADTLVFLQRDWDRIANEQFEARVDRPGQRAQSVTIIDVVSEGTLEEWDKVEKLEAKYRNFQEVVNDDRTLRAALAWKGEA